RDEKSDLARYIPGMTQTETMIDQGRRALTLDAAVVERVTQMIGDLAVNLVVAVLILAATFFIARWASGAVGRALGRLGGARRDPMLQGFLVQVVRVVVITVGLIA